jgi:small-conductance mechanosensitive channel
MGAAALAEEIDMEWWSMAKFGQFWELAQPFIVGVALFVFALLVRKIIYWILHGWVKESTSDIGDLIIRVTKSASLLWCFLLGAYLAIRIGAAPSWENTADKVLLGVGILSAALVAANVVQMLIRSYAMRTKIAVPLASLTQTVAKAIIIGIGSLYILDSLGFNISGILAALGIGTLAVALAVQTTLSNLFSGAFIILSGHIKPNDYIKLDSGDQGYVMDISWGTTRLKTLSGSIVIIPNSRLAGAVVTNHNLPQKRASVGIIVHVSYASDPDLIERLLIEEAKGAVGQVSGLLDKPVPVVRFIPGFGEISLGFTLVCHVRDFTDQNLVEHELRTRIFKRFRAQGIQMPS